MASEQQDRRGTRPWKPMLALAVVGLLGTALLMLLPAAPKPKREPVPRTYAAQLTRVLERERPGWAVERVYTQAPLGPGREDTVLVAQLKWRATPELRMVQRVRLGPRIPPEAGWDRLPASLFQSRQDSAEFVRDFCNTHTSRGLVVEAVLPPRAQLTEPRYGVSYWSLEDETVTAEGELQVREFRAEAWVPTREDGAVHWRAAP
jgi:hypothetical protein